MIKIILKNYMEVIVEKFLPSVLESCEDVCKCERCKLDIIALALNNLPPKYVVSDKGEVYTKISTMAVQFEADVIKEILNAIKNVSENPRH